MGSPVRVQMKLLFDSGSIIYEDKDDGMGFHIEHVDGGEGDPVLHLCMAFLRQYLVKNGRPSTQLIPLMKAHRLGDLVKMVLDMHVAQHSGVVEGVEVTYRFLGTLVSMLEQRQKALVFLEEKMAEIRDHKGQQGDSDSSPGQDLRRTHESSSGHTVA